MTNKEQCEKRIRELVPSLQELEFGCEIKNNLTDAVLHVVENCDPMANEDCDITLFSNSSLYLFEASSKDKDLEILGKPIHLEDVLRAIDKHLGEEDSWEYAVRADGEIVKDYGEGRHDTVGIKYDLSKPFSEQPEEVYEFLNTILV